VIKDGGMGDVVGHCTAGDEKSRIARDRNRFARVMTGELSACGRTSE
jgi:hypothetical protein